MSSKTRNLSGEERCWRDPGTLKWRSMPLLVLLVWSCTPKVVGAYESTRAAVTQVDDFGMLLLEAGLAPGTVPIGQVMTVDQAQQLRMLLRLELADGNMKSYGPRVTADFLLAEAMTGGGVVARSVLNERLRKFKDLAVLRPDGYLAQALTGAPLQCVGPVQVQGNYAHTLTEEEEGGRPLGIIHRDVSPRNIRVDRKTGAVKLTDFGAAFSKRVGREETPGRLLKGDLLYASPEYLSGAEMDARSDIFSLGLVLLEALTLRHLFNVEDSQPVSESATRSATTADETPSLPLVRMITLAEQLTAQDVERVVADLPEGLKAILRRALGRSPADRYASAEEMRRDLHAQLVALAPGYGRREAAEEVARLFTEASSLRDIAEPVESGIYPEGLDAHELAPGSGERRV